MGRDIIVWQRLLSGVISFIVMAIVSKIINGTIEAFQNGSFDSLIPKHWFLTSNILDQYEKQISEFIIKPDEIHERLDTIGGLKTLKDDIRFHVLMPLRHPHVFFDNDKSL